MKHLAIVSPLLLVLVSPLAAAPPPILGHQGRIVVSGTNYDGTGYFKFSLIDGAASESFWTNDGTAVGAGVTPPVGEVPVAVTKGHYSVLLGAAPMVDLPAAVFSEQADLRLRIWFSSTSGGTFNLLAPDRRITPAGYAFAAGTATSLAPGYETGSGTELALGSIGGGGELSLAATYTETFGSTPGVTLGAGWTLESNDESGFSASASFAAQTVDADGLAGSYASLALVGGRPAIAYRNDDDGDLLFVRSVDSSGASWPLSSITRVAGFGSDDVGEYCSLAVIAGRPSISYYDAGAGDLKFVRANDATGTSWPAAITVDGTSGNVGRYTSLAIIGGVPAISYTSPNTGEVMYAWAADAEGTTWPAANIVAIEGAAPGDIRQFASLAEIGGKPAIATYRLAGGDLRYLYLTGADAANPAHWTGVDVDTAGNVGREPALSLIGGNPAIVYNDGAGSLKYARANDAAGAGWGAAVPVAAAGAQGSLVEIGGRPAVSFYDPLVGDLKFVWAGDATGASWPAANAVTVDGALANVGTHSSLAVVGGLPAVAYKDESTFDLKYAALPVADWQVGTGAAEPILASGVKDGAIRRSMLSSELGVWGKSGDDLFHSSGRVGVGRLATSNALEVEGNASKTTAGSWLANSDRRIKTDIREVEDALAKINAIRLVDFEYTAAYRSAHPSIEPGKRYPNVVAQEFAEVFPDWVGTSGEALPGSDADQILQVDTYPLTIYSAAAIQELADENAELRGRVEKLEQALRGLLE